MSTATKPRARQTAPRGTNGAAPAPSPPRGTTPPPAAPSGPTRDLYLALNAQELEIDQYIAILALAELEQAGAGVDARLMRTVLENLKVALAPCVKDRSGVPVTEGEAQRYVGRMRLSDVPTLIEAIQGQAVPPGTGSA